jgi:hypothetical protein
MNIERVNIEFFMGCKKIKQQRISFVLGYLRMILWKISTAIIKSDSHETWKCTDPELEKQIRCFPYVLRSDVQRLQQLHKSR